MSSFLRSCAIICFFFSRFFAICACFWFLKKLSSFSLSSSRLRRISWMFSISEVDRLAIECVTNFPLSIPLRCVCEASSWLLEPFRVASRYTPLTWFFGTTSGSTLSQCSSSLCSEGGLSNEPFSTGKLTSSLILYSIHPQGFGVWGLGFGVWGL